MWGIDHGLSPVFPLLICVREENRMFVYADNAATTALSDAAAETLYALSREAYGNPGSLHRAGREAARVLRNVRKSVADCLGADPDEVYFTGCATESNNWVLCEGARMGAAQGKKHIISSVIEHSSVLRTLMSLEQDGFEVTLLPVRSSGVVDPKELSRAIRRDTCLVSIMTVNNEIGTIQPVSELGEICRKQGVLFHTDAVQAVGHIPVDFHAMGADFLSLSGHKFHGPKGVGALLCRKGTAIGSFLKGGEQERGYRAGTEAVATVAAMAAALEESCSTLLESMAYVRDLRDTLAHGLSAIPGAHRNGDARFAAPGIVNFSFPGVEGESLLLNLDMVGICASSGSACTSHSEEPSHVLTALGLRPEDVRASLRLSLSKYNTADEVEYMVKEITAAVLRLRKQRE